MAVVGSLTYVLSVILRSPFLEMMLEKLELLLQDHATS